MTEMYKRQSWNNIPIPLKELFGMLCDAFIGQDIHSWERKCLMNERFKRLQNMIILVQSHIKKTKTEVSQICCEINESAKLERVELRHDLNRLRGTLR